MSSSYQGYNTKSDSSDSIAMLLEIIFGFFGILGMGWLYAGNFVVAIAATIGFLIVFLLEIAISIGTLGFAACCFVPINLAIIVMSGLKARDYVRNTGAHGSILYVIIAVIIGAVIICGGIVLLTGGLAIIGETL